MHLLIYFVVGFYFVFLHVCVCIGNLSGVLINSDYVLDYPRPLPPTFINIGGLQIKEEPGALPQQLQLFLDEAPAGAILFTMGFIFSPDTVPPERVLTFLRAFRWVIKL